MLCEQCKQAPATVHITQIVNDTKREMHLCEDCAGKVAGETGTAWPGISFSKLLGGLLAPEAVAGLATAAPASGGRCPNCGLSFADFRRWATWAAANATWCSRSSWSRCSAAFTAAPSTRAKSPPARRAPLRLQRELEGLRQELKEAIGKEDYERAAVLRDRIRLLERHRG